MFCAVLLAIFCSSAYAATVPAPTQYQCVNPKNITGAFNYAAANYPNGICCQWGVYIPAGYSFKIVSTVQLDLYNSPREQMKVSQERDSFGWHSPYENSGNYTLSINTYDNTTLQFNVYLKPVCDSPFNVTQSSTYPASPEYFPIGIECSWRVTVPSGYYFKVVTTSSALEIRNIQDPASVLENIYSVNWYLDGSYAMNINTNDNITLFIQFYIQKLPARPQQTVRLAVAAPAQLINISSSLATSNYYFTTNNDFEGVGVALSVAIQKTAATDTTILQSCFAISQIAGATLRKIMRLSDLVGAQSTYMTFTQTSNCTVTCLETVNILAYLVAQEQNNLLGIDIYSTVLLSNFSLTPPFSTQDTEAVTVVNPTPNTYTRVVAIESSRSSAYLNVSDSSPQKVSNISYPVGSGPIDISGQMVTFRFPRTTDMIVFIVPSSPAAGSFCLTLLSLFVIFRHLF